MKKTRKGEVTVDTDEHVKPGTTVEGLAKLRTAFKKDGTVTAGNASGVNDAAAFLVLADAEVAREANAKRAGAAGVVRGRGRAEPHHG